MSRNFHDHIRCSILPPQFAVLPRPVAVNTWEAYHFDVDESKLLLLADKAVALGIDTVVLDDGWFRRNDREKLGDWTADPERFPHGLSYAASEVHKRGLRFGLWFEPEMVSEDSELYRSHPDWIIGNGDKPYLSRNQLVLDFSRPEAVDYIFARMDSILAETQADFIKWDANRYLSETGSAYTGVQGEVMHRRTLGLYSLLARLSAKYPHVLIESCAGGGGRFDAGMLFYTPQIWLSDNTNPLSRKDMQWGISLAYPPSTVSCHVTDGKWLDGFDTDIVFRYMVASFGTYGYEFDLLGLEEDTCGKIRRFNEMYRETEDLVLQGDLYRLYDGPYWQAYMQVSKDKRRARLTFLLIRARMGMEYVHIRLDGLDTNKTYINDRNNLRLSGDALMKAGILISDLNCPHETNAGKELFFNEVKQSGGGMQIVFESED